jgi:hypothetical protein
MSDSPENLNHEIFTICAQLLYAESKVARTGGMNMAVICKACGADMADDRTVTCRGNTMIKIKGESLPAIPYQGERRCHDCNIAPGGNHHLHCDMEDCPRCGGQLLSCGCLEFGEKDY